MFKKKKRLTLPTPTPRPIGFAIPISESPEIIISCVWEDRHPKPSATTVFVRPTDSRGPKLELLKTKQNKNIGRGLF